VKPFRYNNGLVTITFKISSLLWLLLSFTLFLLFFIGGPSYYSSPVFKEFWNIGHIIFFAITTYLLITFIKHKHIGIIITLAFAYCFVLGMAIELLQAKIGRSFDLHDVYRDILGGCLAISYYFNEQFLTKKAPQQTPNKASRKLKAFARLTFLFSLILITLDQTRLYQLIKLDIQIRNNFPMIADFENKNELKQWSGKNLTISNEYVLTGLYSMKVELSAETKYSGFTLKHMSSNWSNYQYLLINIYNPSSETLKLSAKITDFEHDIHNQAFNNRYNQTITLAGSQWTKVKIKLADIKNGPNKRKLDLSQMSQLGLFTTGLTENKIIFLDSITLI
jgi:hypothetical protein